MIRILIADDHAVVRRGLRQMLTDESDLKVVGEAHNSQELLALARQHTCELMILDISMPGRNGLDVLRELRQEFPKTAVLVLSMHPEDQYAVQAFRAGASGYLTKESAPEELVLAIRKVVRGGRYVSAALAEKMAVDLSANRDKAPHETLSTREFQILCMIGSGKSLTEIADELALSVKTIATYRARILEKTEMKNNAELIRYTIHNRLVT
jgi:two-component system, NarL family, invasion response regulator UvrY